MSDAAPPASGSSASGIGREPAVMSVRGAAAWAMAGQYLSFAIQFAASVVISRFFLDPAEIGLFSIALAAALLVAVLNDFGLSRYISALPRLDGEEIVRCGSVSLLLSLAVAAVIALGAWPIASLYGLPGLAPILLIIAGSYLFLPLSVVPLALMGRQMGFRGHFAVNVGGALAQATVAIALAAQGFSSLSLAWAAVALTLSRGLIAQLIRPALPWPIRLDRLGPVLRFGGKSSLLAVSGALGTRTPDLVVGKILTLFATGLYSRAVSLTEQVRMLIGGAIGGVFFPAFARIRDRGEPLGPAYLRVCAGYSAVVWPGMAGLALAAEPVVRLLYGDVWIGTAPLLTLIALHTCILTMLPLVSELPILLGRIDRLLALNIVDTVLSLALLALGCLWGVEGAAASRIVYALAWMLLYFGFMRRLVGFDLRAWLALYIRSLAATLAALAPLALTFAFWQGPDRIEFPVLLGAVALGGMAWFAALVLVRHPALPDIVGIAETAMPRRLVNAIGLPARGGSAS